MASIVTLIDEPQRAAIENVWGELKAVFGLPQLRGATAPCFTWNTAQRFDDTALDKALTRVVAEATPPHATTGQLALLRGLECVLYIPVIADDALLDMHARIRDAVGSTATGANAAYATDTWAPHISVAVGPMSEAEAEDVLPFLGIRDTSGRVPVTNLTVIPDSRSAPASWRRFVFPA